jgi:hypothetical protein
VPTGVLPAKVQKPQPPSGAAYGHIISPFFPAIVRFIFCCGARSPPEEHVPSGIQSIGD